MTYKTTNRNDQTTVDTVKTSKFEVESLAPVVDSNTCLHPKICNSNVSCQNFDRNNVESKSAFRLGTKNGEIKSLENIDITHDTAHKVFQGKNAVKSKIDKELNIFCSEV